MTRKCVRKRVWKGGGWNPEGQRAGGSGSGPNSGAPWKCAMTKRQLIKVAD